MSQSNEPFDPYYQWLGIPPEEQPANHYRLLGIQLYEQNRVVIQHAADRQMVHLRSFQNGPRAAQSQQLLNQVAAAKLCLLSPDRKAAYDADLMRSITGASVMPPPMSSELPAEPPLDVVFGGSSGTRVAVVPRRTVRFHRPQRGSWVPWILALLALGVASLAGWHWWSGQLADERLILVWPAAERQDASMRLDGRPVDLVSDPAASSAEALTFLLPKGAHHVQIARPGYEAIDQSVELVGGQPVYLTVQFVAVSIVPSDLDVALSSVPGRVVLRWPAAARHGAVLQIDGRSVDLGRRSAGSSDTVEAVLKAGEHTLHIELSDGQTLDRTFSVEPGQQWELDVEEAARASAARIVLLWPAPDRAESTLEVDGQVRDIAALAGAGDAEQVLIDMAPGKHTVRITRPGFDDFVMELTDLRGEERIAVSWVAVEHPRPAAPELERLRGDFRQKYEQFEEYQKWTVADAANKSELLRILLARLETEAGTLPSQSPEQWAACDEMLQLALAGQEFVLAHNLLRGNVGHVLFSDTERQTWEDRIWAAALQSKRADALADYLKLRHAAGDAPTAEEQEVIVEQLAAAVAAGSAYAEVVARVEDLEQAAVLGQDVATRARVEVYLRAAAGEFTTPLQALDLCEQMLKTVPLVFVSGLPDALQRVDRLADAVGTVRRNRALRDEGLDADARTRLLRLNEGVKLVRECASQFTRVRTAQDTIANKQGTPADHRFVAFWLLQLGQFSAALPYLRAADDEGLARIARPLPETARELAQLADEVDAEAKRSKFSRRQEESLRAYARHLRQSALNKNDLSLPPAERMELQNKLEAVQL